MQPDAIYGADMISLKYETWFGTWFSVFWIPTRPSGNKS